MFLAPRGQAAFTGALIESLEVYAVPLLGHANVLEIDTVTLVSAGRVGPIEIVCQATNEPDVLLDVILAILIVKLNAGVSCPGVCPAPLIN